MFRQFHMSTGMSSFICLSAEAFSVLETMISLLLSVVATAAATASGHSILVFLNRHDIRECFLAALVGRDLHLRMETATAVSKLARRNPKELSGRNPRGSQCQGRRRFYIQAFLNRF